MRIIFSEIPSNTVLKFKSIMLHGYLKNFRSCDNLNLLFMCILESLVSVSIVIFEAAELFGLPIPKLKFLHENFQTLLKAFT